LNQLASKPFELHHITIQGFGVVFY